MIHISASIFPHLPCTYKDTSSITIYSSKLCLFTFWSYIPWSFRPHIPLGNKKVKFLAFFRENWSKSKKNNNSLQGNSKQHCKKKSPEPGWDWVKPKRIGPRAVARPGNLVFIIQKPGLADLEGAPGCNSDFLIALYYLSRVQPEIIVRTQTYNNLGHSHRKSDSQTRKHRTLFIPKEIVSAHNIFLSRPEIFGAQPCNFLPLSGPIFLC